MKSNAGECFEAQNEFLDIHLSLSQVENLCSEEMAKRMRENEDNIIRKFMKYSACSPQFLHDQLLESEVDVLRRGGEIYWMDGDIKHTHSVAKPHHFMPFGCNGQCCDQPKPNESSDKEIQPI
jgi:hypothetical protein